MSPEIRRMGNTFFCIVSATDFKLFAARASGEEVAMYPQPYIAPLTELENVTRELVALHMPSSTHTLGFGYTLTIYSQHDHDALLAAFGLFLGDLMNHALKRKFSK